jgi:methylenetetrahydrofolate reductase (NADPH)
MSAISNLQAVFEAGKFAVTAEAGPPRGAGVEEVIEKKEKLDGFVDACNVTDNQTSVVRMSSVAACRILKEHGMEPVLQMVCRDRNRIAMQSDLLGAYALGIRNVLALSGDHQRFGDHFTAKNVYDIDSIQFIRMIRRMGDEKKFASGDDIKGDFQMFVGAAWNPFGDPRPIRVPRLAKKIKAGSQFIQTQCIYNLEYFEEVMDKVVQRGLHEQCYIMGGVTPLKSFRMANYMAKNVAGMDIPEAVLTRIKSAPKGVKGAQKKEGIQIAIETIQKLQKIKGVAGVHVMAIEWESLVPELVKSAGLHPRPTPSAQAA